MMYRILFTAILFTAFSATAQLSAGYQSDEATELIKLNFRFVAKADSLGFPPPERFKLAYRSPVMGTDNMWDFWEDEKGVGVISIRGTTGSQISWMSNFYTAMVTATGKMKISERDTFVYDLAGDTRAAVHVGWLFSMACLMRDIAPKLDEFVNSGRRDLLLTGHSQGGAITYLLSAHLRSLQAQGKLPSDLRIKTYCSAAPKPGNLYFAYDYEAKTYNGWAYNTVNAADWVPETPMSVQTAKDFALTNPITDAKKNVRGMPLGQRIVIKYLYNSLDKPTRKAQRRFDKYATKIGKSVTKENPGYEQPESAQTAAYVRCGNFVTLLPDDDYYALYPPKSADVFIHHSLLAYLYLMERESRR